jgi:hypothetical protein
MLSLAQDVYAERKTRAKSSKKTGIIFNADENQWRVKGNGRE